MKKRSGKSIRQRLASIKAAQKIRNNMQHKWNFSKLKPLIFNRYIGILAGIISIYVLLLVLLILVESRSPDANIRNIGQAFWYSLVTFTTVGYGDLYPVTFMGRFIASVFLLVGIGLLGFFIGFMVECIAKIRPAIILSMNTMRPWYVFTGVSNYAEIFAENLLAVRPDAMIIFAETTASSSVAKAISVPWTVEEILERRGSLYDAHLMCMKENEMENFLEATALADIEAPIICLASFTPAHHAMNINFFSLADSTARIYWQQYPIEKPDEIILLIGFGSAGEVLLDRAIELNVLFTRQRIQYHVFGDSGEYHRNRKLLSDIVAVNKFSNAKDSVIFHEEPWNDDEQLLRNADRILLCSDDEQENIAILHMIQKFFATKGNIYIYNSNVRGVATSFGKTRDVLTPAFVLHNTLSDMALARHEFFRFSTGGELPMWEDTNSLTKDMNYIAIDHISLKVRILLGDKAPRKPFDELEPEILREAMDVFHGADENDRDKYRALEHERSLRFYKLHNFRESEKLNDDKRLNPLVAPYKKLPDTEKALMDISWEIMGELATHKEARRNR